MQQVIGVIKEYSDSMLMKKLQQKKRCHETSPYKIRNKEVVQRLFFMKPPAMPILRTSSSDSFE